MNLKNPELFLSVKETLLVMKFLKSIKYSYLRFSILETFQKLSGDWVHLFDTK